MAALGAAGTDGMVGPTAPSNWTCVWVNDEDFEAIERLGFAAYVWADETRSGLRIELRQPGDGSKRLSWSKGSDVLATNALAGALVDLFGLASSSNELRALLARTDLDAKSLWEGLEDLLDLPEIASPEPERCVMATRAEPAMVRLGAAIAGPAWILPSESGWTVLTPTGDHESASDLLAAAVSGATKRRDRTILLWARDEAFGLQVWRGGSVDVSWSWGSGWETVVSNSVAFETEVSAAIAALNPNLHLPSLRALLRRRDLDAPEVASLVMLLDLPAIVAATLTASPPTEGFPGAELIPRATPTDATMAAFRADWAGRGRVRNRRLYLAYSLGTALAAVVCLAMTGLGIAVLITDGSVIDQASATNEDRVFIGVFAVLALILIPTAFHRLRRARKSRNAE